MPDHLTRIPIFDPRQIQPPFRRRDLGDVGHPRLIRARRGERLSQEVVRHRQSMRRIRGEREPSHRCTAQAQCLPQPLDAADPSWKTVFTQFRLETLRAVRVSTVADAARPRSRFGTPPVLDTTDSADTGDAVFS